MSRLRVVCPSLDLGNLEDRVFRLVESLAIHAPELPFFILAQDFSPPSRIVLEDYASICNLTFKFIPRIRSTMTQLRMAVVTESPMDTPYTLMIDDDYFLTEDADEFLAYLDRVMDVMDHFDGRVPVANFSPSREYSVGFRFPHRSGEARKLMRTDLWTHPRYAEVSRVWSAVRQLDDLCLPMALLDAGFLSLLVKATNGIGLNWSEQARISVIKKGAFGVSKHSRMHEYHGLYGVRLGAMQYKYWTLLAEERLAIEQLDGIYCDTDEFGPVDGQSYVGPGQWVQDLFEEKRGDPGFRLSMLKAIHDRIVKEELL